VEYNSLYKFVIILFLVMREKVYLFKSAKIPGALCVRYLSDFEVKCKSFYIVEKSYIVPDPFLAELGVDIENSRYSVLSKERGEDESCVEINFRLKQNEFSEKDCLEGIVYSVANGFAEKKSEELDCELVNKISFEK